MKKILITIGLIVACINGFGQVFVVNGSNNNPSVDLNTIVYTNDMEEYQFTSVKHNIDGKVLHNVKLIDSDTMNIIVDYVKIIIEPETTPAGGTTKPVISIGDNSTSYDNIVGNTTLSFNADTIIIPTILYTSYMENDIYLKVSTAATAGFFDFTCIVKYHKIDLQWRGAERYLNSETAILTNRFGSITLTQKQFIDSTITMLKDSALWTKFDLLYMFNVGDETGASQNWISNTYNLTSVPTVNWTTKLGIINVDATGYYNTGWKPSNGVNFTQDSASVFVKSSTNLTTNTYEWGLTDGTSKKAFAGVRYGGHFYGYLNSATGIDGSTSTSIGLFSLTRDVTNIYGYADKVNKATTAIASTAPNSTHNMYIGGVNNQGSLLANSRKRISFWAAGSYFTAAEVSTLVNILTWWDAHVSMHF